MNIPMEAHSSAVRAGARVHSARAASRDPYLALRSTGSPKIGRRRIGAKHMRRFT